MNLLEIDEEVDFLKISVKALDVPFLEISKAIAHGIKNGLDVDSSGLCDKGEFIAGLAFVACQKYITSTLGWFKTSKKDAFNIGRVYTGNTTYVEIINAVANYWKHSDEWDCISLIPEIDNDMLKVIPRDYEKLKYQASQTIDVIQCATPWGDYLSSNALYELTRSKDLSLLALIPILTEWRSELLNLST